MAGRVVARVQCALGHLRRRLRDRGLRAGLRLGTRADHPHLPRLPPPLQAPPHRDRRGERLLRPHPPRGPARATAFRCRRRRCASARAPFPISPGSRRWTPSRARSAAAARTSARPSTRARSSRRSCSSWRCATRCLRTDRSCCGAKRACRSASSPGPSPTTWSGTASPAARLCASARYRSSTSTTSSICAATW